MTAVGLPLGELTAFLEEAISGGERREKIG